MSIYFFQHWNLEAFFQNNLPCSITSTEGKDRLSWDEAKESFFCFVDLNKVRLKILFHEIFSIRLIEFWTYVSCEIISLRKGWGICETESKHRWDEKSGRAYIAETELWSIKMSEVDWSEKLVCDMAPEKIPFRGHILLSGIITRWFSFKPRCWESCFVWILKPRFKILIHWWISWVFLF